METLIATATFGLEAVVSRELEALGYAPRTIRPGWLAFRGDENAIALTNLWLRASDRVLVEMASFTAEDFGVLFDATRAAPWERFLPANASFPVRGRSVKSKLSSVPACQRIVKKAIVERLKEAHRRQTLDESGPSFPIEIALLSDQVTLAIDTTGAGLHKRGYRPLTGEAPLKETLAAGLILLSFWDRERPFLDPFCGSGTLAIEAALIARNRAPGVLREFVSESWPSLSRDAWRGARERARSLEVVPPNVPIVGSDKNAKVLDIARIHAAKAGVAGDVRFEHRAFDEIRCHEPFGCLITNPPYGDRLGDLTEARELYRSMPAVLRKFDTWSHYILTSSRELETLFGQKADRRRKLYNGRIECTYYQFFGPRPGGKEHAAAFGGIDSKGEHQLEIFTNRLKKRARHMRKWPTKRGVDAYRLYDRDIKEVPLSVDRYGDFVLVTPNGERRTLRSKAQHEDWLDAMVGAVGASLDVPTDHIVVAGRPTETREVTVHESGLELEARLDGSRDTGIALEARLLRRHLREIARGKRVLCTGVPEGVAATAGGAASVSYTHAPGTDYDVIVSVFSDETEAAVERARSSLASDGVAYFVVRGHQRIAGAEDVTGKMLPEDFRGRRRVRIWMLTRA